MRRFRRHDRSDTLPPLTYEEAALHVRALVTMATIDGDVRTGELECLVELVDALGTTGTRGRLLGLLRMLLDGPPFAEDVLDDLALLRMRTRRAPALVRALQRVAEADGRSSRAELDFELEVVRAMGPAPRLAQSVG